MIVDFLHFNSNVFEPIIISATHVEIVSSFKSLGVYITSDLTWSVNKSLRNPIGGYMR